ncbi:MAG: 4'-phosphopantetheinyl transferase superfamily protein [Clostridia bacterium]|nr:4'-phosphopantetheinyl transferase superfamily protein [Clostridia bacterium]
MLEVYFTKNESVHKKAKILIARHICGSFEVKTEENGKPYVDGNPVYFSISHSGKVAVIALSNSPVGVDVELFKRRKFESIVSRFTDREKSEINVDFNAFLRNWTAKEAFVKMNGGTLAMDLKKLEFIDGNLFYNGVKQDAYLNFFNLKCGICAIFGGVPLSERDVKRFRLRKGETL